MYDVEMRSAKGMSACAALVRCEAVRYQTVRRGTYRVAALLSLIVLALASACGGSHMSPSAPPQAPEVPLSGTASLRDWGLTSVDELSFVSLAIYELGGVPTDLALYEARAKAPERRRSETMLWRSEAPMLSDGAFVITRFSYGNYNRLGGAFGSFSKAPSTSSSDLLSRGRGLRLRYKKEREGFSGLWMHLFDDRLAAESRTYLHTGAATHLVFDIRGARGGENVDVRIADREWLERQDSVRIGPVGSFLASGTIRKGWQRAVVPLSALPANVEHEELASLVFQVETQSEGTVFLRNLGLVAGEDTALPPASESRKARRKASRRALWVWQTRNLIGNDVLREELFAICAGQEIRDVFLQLTPLEDAPQWASMLDLVEGLHARGLRVHALHGAPEFGLAENHEAALAVARAVVASNTREPKRRSFDALRFDVEPYLLPGFRGPAKERLLREYLELYEKLRVVAHRATLPLGADIPFWFDGEDAYGTPTASLDGRPVSELIMDRVDNIAIMAYRTSPYGADGILAHVMGELDYAERTGTNVYIGLETGALPDERVGEFVARSEAQSENEAADQLWVWPHGKAEFGYAFVAGGDAQRARQLAEAHPKARRLFLRSQTVAPASKVTFAGSSSELLLESVTRVSEELGVFDATYGVALHAFESLKAFRR